ncbi:FAD-dependent monooxygenase [Falsigemmobacter intermedius]|uniref:2-octaprenyl-6-methoxyphenyl hydroxylase n=1 Tax=Falsigemmobacter intermedius TaxID=1553448 RepID=A0A444MDS1_9RHOB|nr:FAD-dependent monooxygenase [Falsigemmobacter intermedius]RWY42977.1 2-octaprenyl-6-methoxyphenyl hydroxylase [Falsigemmobacter intermedius]
MEQDVIIAGGGLNGPALALALAQAGFHVTLVDARPDGARAAEGFDGRAYALALASQRLLAALGVWPEVAREATAIEAIRTSDGVPQGASVPFFLSFDRGELDEGPMGFLLEDRYLHKALVAAIAAEPKIRRLSGVSVVAQEAGPEAISVTLSTGEGLSARLLVGCDGRGSGVAGRAGIRRQGWGYGQTALVNALQLDAPHSGVAHQVFLPGGPVAILPLSRDRVSIVWSEEERAAARIRDLPDSDYLDLLMEKIGHLTGPAQLTGDRFSYPLSLSLAESYIAPRVALAGDAAHGIHPIAGQGLNLGLRDVAALAEVLADARARGEDLAAGNVLERYQTWRRFDATSLALGMDVVNRLFSNHSPLARGLRGLGMRAVAALDAPRRSFIREAAGLSGELPRLLQGRRL